MDSAVCREHSVRWTWRGKHYHSADDPADPDYKPEVEKLESFREVEPFYEPLPIRNALDSASSNAHTDGLARRIEEELVEVAMENLPSNEMVIAEQEKEKWLAIRREEALKINPQTAEVLWKYGQTLILTGSSPNCRQNTSKSGGNIFPGVPAATYGFGSGIYPPLPAPPCGKNIKQSWRFPQESRSSSHAVIRAYDERGNLIETDEKRGRSQPRGFCLGFFSRRQDRELRGAISRGLLDCPCRV